MNPPSQLQDFNTTVVTVSLISPVLFGFILWRLSQVFVTREVHQQIREDHQELKLRVKELETQVEEIRIKAAKR